MDIIKFPDKDVLEKAIKEPVYDNPPELLSAEKKYASMRRDLLLKKGKDCSYGLIIVIIIVGILCIIGGLTSDKMHTIMFVSIGSLFVLLGGGMAYAQWKSCRIKAVAKSLSKVAPV